MATQADIFNYLTDNAATFRVLSHPPIYSAQELARVHHVMKDEVADYAVYKADYKFILVVIPAGTTINESDLCNVLQVRELVRSSEWDIERLFPGCEIGAAPLLGNLFGLVVVADSTFEKRQRIVFHVCSHAVSIMVNWRDYKHTVDPIIAAIAVPATGVRKVTEESLAEQA